METTSSPLITSASQCDDAPSLDAAIYRVRDLSDEHARRMWLGHCLATLPVDTFLPALKTESERYLAIDPPVALRYADALALAGEMAGRPAYHALGLMARGDYERAVGHYAASVATMDDAGARFRACGDEVGWARTRIGWLASAQRLGRGGAALAVVDHARATLIRAGDDLRAASLDVSAAYVCQELGQYERGLALLNRALAAYRAIGAGAEIRAARASNNKAILLNFLGRFPDAMRLHEEARRVYERNGNIIEGLRCTQNVAFVYMAQGQYTRALHHFTAARAGMERGGFAVDAAWVMLDVAECHLNLNRDAEALAVAEAAATCFATAGAPPETAKAHFLAALAHRRLGHGERALDALDEAGAAFAAAGLAMWLAQTRLQRAMLHLDAARWEGARAEAERASALFAERGLVIRQAQADLARGRAALALGDLPAVSALAESALAISGAREVEWLAHEAHHLLGAVAAARGDLPAAHAAYGRAVRSVERVQSALAVELRAHFLDDKRHIYQDAIALCLRLGEPEAAFAYLERAKSRALVDYLASNLEVRPRASADADPELIATLARLREEHHWFSVRLSGGGLTQRADAGMTEAETETLRAGMRDREARIARLLERLALDRTEGLGVAPAAIPEGRDALPRLDPGTALVEYYLPDAGGAVFVVIGDDLAVVPLAASAGEIHRLMRQWQTNLAATARAIASGTPIAGLHRNARGILAALHRALIAPVVARIAGCERLVVVPYGPLHAVPFHALFDGGRYLVEDVEVAVCPSSALLALCAGHPRGPEETRALVLAHSDGGRLPAVHAEADAVTASFPGVAYREADATRARLIAAAPRHRVLHLAAHGEARLDNPTFAHLRLADGQVTATDVFNLRLQGALVTLSACETGRSAVTGGDELIGLSRGFLHAGAATLVQSLWRVEDDATARTMAHFYRALRAGHTKGAALRGAQRALLAADGAHPYLWAPFQLVGDSGAL